MLSPRPYSEIEGFSHHTAFLNLIRPYKALMNTVITSNHKFLILETRVGGKLGGELIKLSAHLTSVQVVIKTCQSPRGN